MKDAKNARTTGLVPALRLTHEENQARPPKGLTTPQTLQPSTSPLPPTLPPSRNVSVYRKSWVLQVPVPQILSNRVPNFKLLLVVRVASSSGLTHCSEHVCPAAATWAAEIDFLVHVHKLVIQVLHLCSLDTPVDGLTNCKPVSVHKVVVPICWSPHGWHR